MENKDSKQQTGIENEKEKINMYNKWPHPYNLKLLWSWSPIRYSLNYTKLSQNKIFTSLEFLNYIKMLFSI